MAIESGHAVELACASLARPTGPPAEWPVGAPCARRELLTGLTAALSGVGRRAVAGPSAGTRTAASRQAAHPEPGSRGRWTTRRVTSSGHDVHRADSSRHRPAQLFG